MQFPHLISTKFYSVYMLLGKSKIKRKKEPSIYLIISKCHAKLFLLELSHFIFITALFKFFLPPSLARGSEILLLAQGHAAEKILNCNLKQENSLEVGLQHQ